jgi:hypothetical protein
MGRWKGDITNPAPNSVKESIERSEKFVTNNDPAAFISNDRAEQVRRDTDSQKNFTITFYDIDEAILTQLQQLQIQITDVGKRVAVPIFFGPPERWVSAQRDGFMRDKQGKVILPGMILKRSNSENDQSLMFFNRYLDTPAMKLYSEKNKYTQFNALTGQNAPVNEVYNVVVPKHMVLSYHCIVWTAYVEQMDEVMQTIVFNTQDYWGSKKGFRFRVQVDGGYAHNVEITSGDERMVKTEFDLTTHGYILPDTVTYLERHKMTTQKRMTPKKFIMGMEVVQTAFDLSQQPSNAEKWRNPNYPNLRYDTIIPPPGIVVDTSIQDSSFLPTGNWKGIKVSGTPLFLRVVPVPTSQNSAGQDGDMSYDAQYFYFHSNHQWRWVAISEFTPSCTDNVPLYGTPGSVEYNSKFLYIYSQGSWRKVALAEFDPTISGSQGDIMYDSQYFYLYVSGQWRRVAGSSLQSTTTSCLDEPPPGGFPPEGVPVLLSSRISI